MLLLLRLLLLRAAEAKAEAKAEARAAAFRRGGPTAAIDRWFQFHTNNESYAPKAWTVTKPARRRAAAVARDRCVEQVQDRVSSHREW